MARGNPHGYLQERKYKPAPQNFEGQKAGGSGTFGILNDGKDHTMPHDPKGTMGKAVASGAASGEAKRLIEKSTGVSVEGATPASAFPKPV